MGAIEALLAEHCSNGVEYRSLGEVGTFVRGSGLAKKDFVDEGAPCIHYGQIYTRYQTSVLETESFVSRETAARLKKADPGDLIVTNTSETVEDVCTAVAWMGSGEVAIGGHSCIFRHDLDPMYAAYVFQTPLVHSQKRRFAQGTKVKEVKVSDIAKIRIPVPPLPVQRAISDALLAMEALRDSLRDEEEARRAQFEHYRRLVMDGVVRDANRVALGSVATVVRGASPRPIKSWVTADSTGTPWIKIGDVPKGGRYVTATAERIRPEGEAKSRVIEPGDFILSNSMSFGRPYISKIRGCIHDGWLTIKNYEESFDPEFLYLLMGSSEVYAELSRRAGNGAVRNINADIVRSLALPVPPLAAQREVVRTLEPFGALIDSLAVERQARREQFEHYRDRLVSLPERTVAA